MYELMVESTFSAAHQLIGSKGPCEELHGHTWQVQVFLAGKKLDKIGMLLDFKDIKAGLNAVLQDYDHKFLNKSLPFNPTAENIAREIFEALKKGFSNINKVTVWESPNAAASYKE